MSILRKGPQAEEYINRYRYQSAAATEFVYNTAAAAAGAEMGIKKGIVVPIQHLLPRKVWHTHLVESTEDNKSPKDVTIHDIIQSIQTESINPGSQDTNMGLLKHQSEPHCCAGICIYSAAITKE